MTTVNERPDGAQYDAPDALNVARSLIVAGLPVFTAPPNPGKGTRAEFHLPSKWQNSTPDPAALDSWEPGHALCLVTGHGLDAVDVDPKNGADNAAQAERLNALGVEVLGVSGTPSGGSHLYVVSAGLCSTSDTRDGVDYRGRGLDGSGTGFLYLPGTQRPRYGGRGYAWLEEPDLDRAREVNVQEQRDALCAYLSGLGIRPRLRREAAPVSEVGGEPVPEGAVPSWLGELLSDLGPTWWVGARGNTHESVDRSERFHHLVAACRRARLTQGQTVALLDPWCTAMSKFTGRTAEEVARSWGKVEPEPRETVSLWDSPPPPDPWDSDPTEPEDTEETAPEGPSSWAPLDLTAYLDGTYTPPMPTLLPRTDGACLWYPGLTHSVHGESESGKSLIVQAEAVRLVNLGRPVLVVDFEADAASVVARLLRLGATADNLRAHLHYVRPHESPGAAGNVEAYRALLTGRYDLAVIDGVTDALGLFGGKSSADNDEVSAWFRAFPRRLARETGAAVVLVDHVVKSEENRGRWAIGGQAKMAALDGAAYTVEVVKPLGVGLLGEVVLRIGKDRPGEVRPLCGAWRKSDRTQEAARVVVDSRTEGVTAVTVQAPRVIGPDSGNAEGSGFRPTSLMERLSRVLERSPDPLSKRGVMAEVSGNTDALSKALDVLSAEGYVTVSKGSRGSLLHASARPYRQADDPTSDAYTGEPVPPSVSSETVAVDSPGNSAEGDRHRFPPKGGRNGETVEDPSLTVSRETVGNGRETVGTEEVGNDPDGLQTLDLLASVLGAEEVPPAHECAGIWCQFPECDNGGEF